MNYGADLIDIVAGGHLADTAVNWINQRTTSLRPMLSTTANNFFEQARNVHQMISTSDAVQALRNLTFKKDSIYESNQIHRINTIEGLQTANPINQRWLMAFPELRERYLTNTLEGYGESYNNVFGDVIGSEHYDYRRVMNGVMTPVVPTETIHNYYEPLPDGEIELTIHQKADIINNWNLASNYLDANEMDPTSPLGNLLG